jgi:thiamine kinase-like enzyme
MLNTLIPAERIRAVEIALLKAFNTTEVTEVILLNGGLSSAAVYKIVVDEQAYVLKLDSPSVHENIISSMEIAANADLAPAVYYLNKTDGITITRFITGMPMQSVFKSHNVLLSKLAETIKAIHELPLFSKENSLLHTVDGLIAAFKASGTWSGPVFEECFAHYDLIRNHYPWENTDKVSSHNDLNPNNMVFDGEKIWIIDWDAAFLNDRYVDLAIMANFYVTTDEQENIFLESYFDRNSSDYNKARFFVMRQVCRLVYAILMFKLADTTKPGDQEHDLAMEGVTLKDVKDQLGSGKINLGIYQGQLLFGKALWNEALNSMRSERFNLSIERLAEVHGPGLSSK